MTIKISIIIPLYNEQESIENLISELHLQTEKYSFDAELIFVDDGSTDKTVQKLKEQVTGLHVPVKIIRLSKNFGGHAAIRAGISQSTGDYVTFLPADLQDPPQLPQFLFNEITKGFDTVLAQRISTKSRFVEKRFSMLYGRMMRMFVDKKYPSHGFDIAMFNHKVKSFLLKNEESNSSLYLQILTAGFNQSSIKYNKDERKTGKSKWTLSKKIKLFIDSFIAFSYAPIRFVTIIGFLFFFIGICCSAFAIYRSFFVSHFHERWTVLFSISFLGFGITNISLGIIAEYLWRTLDASRKRPVYIIDEVTELTNRSERLYPHLSAEGM